MVVILALLSGCDTLAWFYRFDDPAVRERTATIESRIHLGACDGEVAYGEVMDRDGRASSTPPALASEPYAFEAVARDAQCHVIGHGCEVVDVAERGEVVVPIAAVPRAFGCAIGEGCTAARCGCRADTARRDCGGGPTCCCANELDLCEAGRCVPVASRRVLELSAGLAHTCARMPNRAVYCWGANEFGEAAGMTTALSPQRIGPAMDFHALHGSYRSSCGIRGGQLYCWGSNDAGQLAHGTGTSAREIEPDHLFTYTPVAAPGLTFVDVRVDRFHGCARTADGHVRCWGSNRVHALQQADTGVYLSPSELAGTWDAVHLGLHRTCTLRDGEQWCSGYAATGRAGVASRNYLATPVQVAPSVRWATLALGTHHSCGIDDAGRLYCWGCGGACGPACDPMNVDQPDRETLDCTYALGARLPTGQVYREDPLEGRIGGATFLAVAASRHTCAIVDDGAGDGAGPLVCFGPNEHGQLGDGTRDARGFDPGRTVLGGARFALVATGIGHTCAVRDSGELYCFGDNREGQLGAHDRYDRLTPERVCIP